MLCTRKIIRINGKRKQIYYIRKFVWYTLCTRMVYIITALLCKDEILHGYCTCEKISVRSCTSWWPQATDFLWHSADRAQLNVLLNILLWLTSMLWSECEGLSNIVLIFRPYNFTGFVDQFVGSVGICYLQSAAPTFKGIKVTAKLIFSAQRC